MYSLRQGSNSRLLWDVCQDNLVLRETDEERNDKRLKEDKLEKAIET
jgi:hypothetical protein